MTSGNGYENLTWAKAAGEIEAILIVEIAARYASDDMEIIKADSWQYEASSRVDMLMQIEGVNDTDFEEFVAGFEDGCKKSAEDMKSDESNGGKDNAAVLKTICSAYAKALRRAYKDYKQ